MSYASQLFRAANSIDTPLQSQASQPASKASKSRTMRDKFRNVFISASVELVGI